MTIVKRSYATIYALHNFMTIYEYAYRVEYGFRVEIRILYGPITETPKNLNIDFISASDLHYIHIFHILVMVFCYIDFISYGCCLGVYLCSLTIIFPCLDICGYYRPLPGIIVQQPSSLTLCFYIPFTTNYCTTPYSRISIYLGPNKALLCFSGPSKGFF